MALPAATKAAMLNAQTAISGFISLHTADPGTTGASEGTAGRVAIAWPNATDSPVAAPAVNVPCTPGTTYSHFGYWSAATGGVFRGGNPLPSTITPAAGTTTVSVQPTASLTAS